MQVFISHIDCLVTTLLDWTENLFVHEQTCTRQEANRCGVTFQSTISAHKHKEFPRKLVFAKWTWLISSAMRAGATHQLALVRKSSTFWEMCLSAFLQRVREVRYIKVHHDGFIANLHNVKNSIMNRPFCWSTPNLVYDLVGQKYTFLL